MPSKLSTKHDSELYAMLGGARSDAHAAFMELYTRYSSRVYTYCRRVMGDSEAAEDMFQETFVRFYKSAENARTLTNAPAFLLRIARNLCLNERRRKANLTVALEDFHLPVNHQQHDSAELMKLVETAIEMLPEHYRDVLVLKEYLGLTYNEIAEISETTMPIVRVRIFRAKQKLRGILAPYLEDLQQ